jgi:hypothetical protein
MVRLSPNRATLTLIQAARGQWRYASPIKPNCGTLQDFGQRGTARAHFTALPPDSLRSSGPSVFPVPRHERDENLRNASQGLIRSIAKADKAMYGEYQNQENDQAPGSGTNDPIKSKSSTKAPRRTLVAISLIDARRKVRVMTTRQKQKGRPQTRRGLAGRAKAEIKPNAISNRHHS